MSNDYHYKILFDIAVKMIRRGESSLDIEAALEAEGPTGGSDLRLIIFEAGKYVTEMQTKSFEATVEAFRQGETNLEVEKKLRALGFHSWDAMVVAERAARAAKAELAQEAKPE